MTLEAWSSFEEWTEKKRAGRVNTNRVCTGFGIG